MEHSNIVKYRLINQQIADNKLTTAQKLLEWMGAIQAQDFNMSKWALGVRLPYLSNNAVQDEFNKGKILRTHLMRPTWHFVSSNDIYWMLQLTVPQIKTATKSRHKELGLNHEVINKCLNIIEKALDESDFLTRDELIKELLKNKIQTDNNRASHIMLCAELEGLVCSGPVKNEKQTYALLENRVPRTGSLFPDEALAALAKKYFQSHGPANIEDFVWWSGLKASDARKGLEFNKKELVSEKVGTETYWFNPAKVLPKSQLDSVYLLPAFDEYLISYRHRDAVLVFENSKKTISSNGIFRPIIVINGQISGVWKREIKREKVVIGIDLFDTVKDELLYLLMEQVSRYGEFLDKKTEIQFAKIKSLN